MSDEILLTIGADGKASLYDDTYDITIHCESQEEQDEVKRVLQNVPHWIPVTEKPIPKGLVLVTYNDGDVDLLRQPTAYRRGDIVAWCELPEPYKGATE